MSILALNQESENKWVARYAGNYGTYTIKVRLGENNQLENYSYSCPSDYSTCKHIGMIVSKIKTKSVSETKVNSDNDETLIRKLFEGNSKEKFLNFLREHAKYNPDFVNKIKLNFFTEQQIKNEINLNAIIQIGLQGVFDNDNEDDYYYNDYDTEVEILDEWKDKANVEIEKSNYTAAFAIAKAMLEEYYEWIEYRDSEKLDYLSEYYEEYPFEILKSIIEKTTTLNNEILLYLKEQLLEEKYGSQKNEFFEIFAILVSTADQKAYYLSLLESALIKCKSTAEEENIIRFLILFYTKQNQPEKEFELLIANLHIDSFRKNVIEKYIPQNNLTGAKQLIHDKLKEIDSNHYKSDWHTYLLQIAELENNTADIQQYAYYLIEYKKRPAMREILNKIK
jgi:hypothetical protein